MFCGGDPSVAQDSLVMPSRARGGEGKGRERGDNWSVLWGGEQEGVEARSKDMSHA